MGCGFLRKFPRYNRELEPPFLPTYSCRFFSYRFLIREKIEIKFVLPEPFAPINMLIGASGMLCSFIDLNPLTCISFIIRDISDGLILLFLTFLCRSLCEQLNE